MFPLRDSIPSIRTPVVNVLLMVACVAVFFYQLALGPELIRFLETRAFIPARLFFPETFQTGVLFALGAAVVSLFLHGGWLHLIGNMWFLWIFGDNVEDVLGHFRYLLFYLVCGLAATLAHALVEPRSIIPVVGASGAIAGVLGAYFVWFPWSRVRSLVFLGFIFTVVEIPAFLFLLVWFVLQFFSGTMALTASTASGGGVAWFAHIGGFVVGAAIALGLRFAGRVRPRGRSSIGRSAW